ncbi:hypothetical protein BGW39_007873 [Mortierella sp. 14UC]|nr:hypothetical protein BGW39_007873 [Mortierella sp. 14UC]
MDGKYISIDVDRILDAMPQLRNLHIGGYRATYADVTLPSQISVTTGAITFFSPTADYKSKMDQGMTIHPLESLTVSPYFMMRPTSNTLTTFKRLGNLKSSNISRDLSVLGSVPGCTQADKFGQILQTYCPKIESIETCGHAALWFLRLPRFSSAFEATMSSAKEAARPKGLSNAAKESPGMDLQRQEMVDTLPLREMSFFPRLTSYIAREITLFASQDLLELAAHSITFLTHIHFTKASVSSMEFSIYQEPTSSGVTAEGVDQMTVYPPGPMSETERQRLTQRLPSGSMYLVLLLEACAYLKAVSFPDAIPFQNMVDTTAQYTSDGTAGAETRTMRRWACEETLESLEVGFMISTVLKSDHRLIWRHPGRLPKLRSLKLTNSNLIPSLDFGMDELVGIELQDNAGPPTTPEAEGEGERSRSPAQQRLREQNKTLEKIHSLGNLLGSRRPADCRMAREIVPEPHNAWVRVPVGYTSTPSCDGLDE